MLTPVSWSSSCTSVDAPKGFKRDGWEKRRGNEPGDRGGSWSLQNGAPHSMSTPACDGSPSRGDGGGDPEPMGAVKQPSLGLGLLGAVGTGTGGVRETSPTGTFGMETGPGRQRGTPSLGERR